MKILVLSFQERLGAIMNTNANVHQHAVNYFYFYFS